MRTSAGLGAAPERKIEGRIHGKAGYKDGTDFTTSAASELRVDDATPYVITASGTVYRLGEPASVAPPPSASRQTRRSSSRLSMAYAPPPPPPTAEELGGGAVASRAGLSLAVPVIPEELEELQEASADGRVVIVDTPSVGARSKPPPPSTGRARRSSTASRPLALHDFAPLQCEVLTPRSSGAAEWCTVAAHVEGKLQILLPEGGKELLSLLDLQGWMKRAPNGYVMTLADVVRPVSSDASDTAAAPDPPHTRARQPLGALVNTPARDDLHTGTFEGSQSRPAASKRSRRGLHSSRRARLDMEDLSVF